MDMDLDDDLSPLSETEYEETSSDTSFNKRQPKQKQEFRLTSALKTPRATTYAAHALCEQISRGDVELDPEYQRDVVWTKQKQITLIDSIFRNCYVPPVIFSVKLNEDGSESRTCIDGKQRLTSIHLFMSGTIPYRDPYTGKQFWYKQNSEVVQSPGEMLPEKFRSIFSNKQIVCVEYEELKEGDERDIFKRVQLGVALTNAEKLQAISTPRTALVRHLIKTYLTETTLGHPDVAWDHGRGRDFQVFATVIYAISKWNKKIGLSVSVHHDPLRTWLAEGGTAPGKLLKGGDRGGKGVPVPEAFRKNIIKVFETVNKLATNPKYNLGFRSLPQISLILNMNEMAGAFVLIYVVYVSPQKSSNAEPYSLRSLGDLFTLLRVRYRRECVDKHHRYNSVGGRVVMDMCHEIAQDPRGYLQRGRKEGLLDGLDDG
ncbi:hypothetical protein E1B28_010658 [Marasmius oreades]|uniref:GmrSD restriction endonucleases N-terminal domain-containing protein n=1 Tax=Marasmius oreades TaxID=181124 RepID=A0A9P7URC9_9AGAR|nr:uncharacterized protein E1B28_010658 [Marasmius oreades]KAG7091637.1 hypothetical protein E1B28_010658 [Marasmius oreades]